MGLEYCGLLYVARCLIELRFFSFLFLHTMQQSSCVSCRFCNFVEEYGMLVVLWSVFYQCINYGRGRAWVVNKLIVKCVDIAFYYGKFD